MTGEKVQGRPVAPGEAHASAAPLPCGPDPVTAGGPRWNLLRALPLAALGALLALAYARGWLSLLSFENVVLMHERFQHLIEQHPYSAVVAYALLYVLVCVLCVPGGALLTAAGGLAFGTLVATAATVLGATAGATLLFLMARSACGSWLQRRQAEWFHRLRAGFERDAFHYMLFLRLVPAFPFWFVNIATAVLGVPLRTFFFGTLLGIVPGTLAFASAGAGLASVIAMAKTKYEACLTTSQGATCQLTLPANALLTKELALALVLLGLVSLIPIAIKKWRRSDD